MKKGEELYLVCLPGLSRFISVRAVSGIQALSRACFISGQMNNYWEYKKDLSYVKPLYKSDYRQGTLFPETDVDLSNMPRGLSTYEVWKAPENLRKRK